jgi:hypothetical protein
LEDSIPSPSVLRFGRSFVADRVVRRDACVADSAGVGPGKALAHRATAIHTAVSSGQTATACARITDYVALVKAQTGKKLSTEQANPLTT